MINVIVSTLDTPSMLDEAGELALLVGLPASSLFNSIQYRWQGEEGYAKFLQRLDAGSGKLFATLSRERQKSS